MPVLNVEKLVDLEGNYTYVGTIERMSRAFDKIPRRGDVYQATVDIARGIKGIVSMHAYDPFEGFSDEEVLNYISSARKIFAATLHKWNPNCPTLGEREDLIHNGILTNELPKV